MNIIPVANDKPFLFGRLPAEMKEVCASFLPNEDLASLRLVERSLRNIPARIPPNPELVEVCKQIYLKERQITKMNAEFGRLADEDEELGRAIVDREVRLGAAPQEMVQELEAEKAALEQQKQAKHQQCKEKAEAVMQMRKQSDLLYEPRGKALFTNLFGSQEAFEQLPVLDIGNRRGMTDYIDFIDPSEMAAPIMRGFDSSGRMFVSIVVHMNGRLIGRTIFQKYIDSFQSFSDGRLEGMGGGLFDSISGHILSRGCISGQGQYSGRNFKIYRALRETIQTGRAVYNLNPFDPESKESVLTKATPEDLEQRRETQRQRAAAAVLAAAAAPPADQVAAEVDEFLFGLGA